MFKKIGIAAGVAAAGYIAVRKTVKDERVQAICDNFEKILTKNGKKAMKKVEKVEILTKSCHFIAENAKNAYQNGEKAVKDEIVKRRGVNKNKQLQLIVE